MAIRPTLWAAALMSFGLATISSAGDLVLSKSNDPQVELSEKVRDILGAERVGISTVSPQKMKRLVTQPTRTNLWFKKPESSVARYDDAYLRSLPAVKGDETWHCLAEALYFEARGETAEGLFAVGEVILNRVESKAFPDDVCDVIYQGTGERYQCQFTYSCDGRAEVIGEPAAWKRVGKVADLLLRGIAPRDLTGGATFYHTKSVQPRWARVFTRTASIGYHYFYRQDARYASN